MQEQHEIAKQRQRLIVNLERVLEKPLIFLGIVWFILIIIELQHGLSRPLEWISVFIWIVFILDFILKFILAVDKKDFLRKNIVTLLSLIVPAFRVVRLLALARFVRTLRLAKVIGGMNRNMRLLNKFLKKRAVGYVIILTVLVDLAGAAGLYNFEGSARVHSYAEALYFTSMFIITLGSEFWPVSPEGRMLTFLVSLYGFTVLGYLTATLASLFLGKDARPEKQHKDLHQVLEQLEMLNRKISGTN
jgi:voltage-gated potassium channel